MAKEEMLQRLQEERQRFLQALEGLSDEQLCQPNAVGKWSIKDVLGHLADWERMFMEEVVRVREEEPPVEPWREGIDRLNAKLAAKKKDLPLDHIMEEFFRVRRELINTIESLPEEALPRNVSVHRQRRNVEWYVAEAWKHDQEHLPDILAWQRKRETTRA